MGLLVIMGLVLVLMETVMDPVDLYWYLITFYLFVMALEFSVMVLSFFSAELPRCFYIMHFKSF